MKTQPPAKKVLILFVVVYTASITHANLEAEANGCGQEELLGQWK